MINIGGDAQDTSYRYKMPRLVTKVEGRGNGIKTVIVNMVDIAKHLHVEPAYPTKFFGIELGAQSKFNAKTERAIVNGSHTQPDMAKMLNKFIDVFVLCPTCKLPEISMKVKKKSGTIKIDCAACGHNGLLQTQHKLVTYILKDSADKSKDKKKDKKDKKDKKGKKDKKKKGEEEEEDEEVKEVKVEKKEKKSKKAKAAPEAEVEVEWLTDTSKDAQRARKEDEFAGMKPNDSLKVVESIIENAGDAANSASTVLKVFLASGDRTEQQIKSELNRLQLARGLDEPQKIKVLLEAIIDTEDASEISNQYSAQSKVLALFAQDKTTGTIMLNCIEEQVGVVEPQLLSRAPHIIQALYEADVLDEDTILSWYDAPPESSWLVNKDVAVAVRGKALPFVTWLKEADEDDEGDSDEE